MPDKKLIFQVRTIFLRSKEMIVVLSLFMFSIVAAMIWLMAGNVSALYDDAALGAPVSYTQLTLPTTSRV